MSIQRQGGAGFAQTVGGGDSLIGENQLLPDESYIEKLFPKCPPKPQQPLSNKGDAFNKTNKSKVRLPRSRRKPSQAKLKQQQQQQQQLQTNDETLAAIPASIINNSNNNNNNNYHSTGSSDEAASETASLKAAANRKKLPLSPSSNLISPATTLPGKSGLLAGPGCPVVLSSSTIDEAEQRTQASDCKPPAASKKTSKYQASQSLLQQLQKSKSIEKNSSIANNNNNDTAAGSLDKTTPVENTKPTVSGETTLAPKIFPRASDSVASGNPAPSERRQRKSSRIAPKEPMYQPERLAGSAVKRVSFHGLRDDNNDTFEAPTQEQPPTGPELIQLAPPEVELAAAADLEEPKPVANCNNQEDQAYEEQVVCENGSRETIETSRQCESTTTAQVETDVNNNNNNEPDISNKDHKLNKELPLATKTKPTKAASEHGRKATKSSGKASKSKSKSHQQVSSLKAAPSDSSSVGPVAKEQLIADAKPNNVDDVKLEPANKDDESNASIQITEIIEEDVEAQRNEANSNDPMQLSQANGPMGLAKQNNELPTETLPIVGESEPGVVVDQMVNEDASTEELRNPGDSFDDPSSAQGSPKSVENIESLSSSWTHDKAKRQPTARVAPVSSQQTAPSDLVEALASSSTLTMDSLIEATINSSSNAKPVGCDLEGVISDQPKALKKPTSPPGQWTPATLVVEPSNSRLDNNNNNNNNNNDDESNNNNNDSTSSGLNFPEPAPRKRLGERKIRFKDELEQQQHPESECQPATSGFVSDNKLLVDSAEKPNKASKLKRPDPPEPSSQPTPPRVAQGGQSVATPVASAKPSPPGPPAYRQRKVPNETSHFSMISSASDINLRSGDAEPAPRSSSLQFNTLSDGDSDLEQADQDNQTAAQHQKQQQPATRQSCKPIKPIIKPTSGGKQVASSSSSDTTNKQQQDLIATAKTPLVFPRLDEGLSSEAESCDDEQEEEDESALEADVDADDDEFDDEDDDDDDDDDDDEELDEEEDDDEQEDAIMQHLAAGSKGLESSGLANNNQVVDLDTSLRRRRSPARSGSGGYLPTTGTGGYMMMQDSAFADPGRQTSASDNKSLAYANQNGSSNQQQQQQQNYWLGFSNQSSTSNASLLNSSTANGQQASSSSLQSSYGNNINSKANNRNNSLATLPSSSKQNHNNNNNNNSLAYGRDDSDLANGRLISSDTDNETDRLLGSQRREQSMQLAAGGNSNGLGGNQQQQHHQAGTVAEIQPQKNSNSKEVLIEGILFNVKYLGSTHSDCEGRSEKEDRIHQAELAVHEVKIMVLDDKNRKIMMDHSLRTISYIADIGDAIVLIVRKKSASEELGAGPAAAIEAAAAAAAAAAPSGAGRHVSKISCHVFESPDSHTITKSISQAFQVAYTELMKASGIGASSALAAAGGGGGGGSSSDSYGLPKELDYQDVLNSQEMSLEELEMFSRRENQREVQVPKKGGERLGLSIVESGWGSVLPTVVISHLKPGGPAHECKKLKVGDQILSVDGISLVGLPLAECQEILGRTWKQRVAKLSVVPCPIIVEVKIKRPDTKYQLGFSVQNGVICSLLRGGIAERGGVRVGHRIMSINGTTVVGVNHDKIVALLANSVGEIRMKTCLTSLYQLILGLVTPVYY